MCCDYNVGLTVWVMHDNALLCHCVRSWTMVRSPVARCMTEGLRFRLCFHCCKRLFQVQGYPFPNSNTHTQVFSLLIVNPSLLNSLKGHYCIKHCEKWLPLKWSSFRERRHFSRIWFWDLRFRIWGLKIKHLKAHNFVWPWCDKGVFSFINIPQLQRPIELKFSQVCYFMHMLRYTNCED